MIRSNFVIFSFIPTNFSFNTSKTYFSFSYSKQRASLYLCFSPGQRSARPSSCGVKKGISGKIFRTHKFGNYFKIFRYSIQYLDHIIQFIQVYFLVGFLKKRVLKFCYGIRSYCRFIVQPRNCVRVQIYMM
jgi:hypothetical protein